MAKETANINKSLFTLGKVIKEFSDKKVKDHSLGLFPHLGLTVVFPRVMFDDH